MKNSPYARHTDHGLVEVIVYIDFICSIEHGLKVVGTWVLDFEGNVNLTGSLVLWLCDYSAMAVHDDFFATSCSGSKGAFECQSHWKVC